MQNNKLNVIKTQISFMYNQSFESLAYEKLLEISHAVHEVLKSVPDEDIPRAFQKALDEPRKTKYPNAHAILQAYRSGHKGAPIGGYYDSRGCWIIDGAYYSIGAMPHWCKSHYLERWQVDLWEKFIDEKCDKEELDKIKALGKIQFMILEGPIQKTIEEWNEPEDYDIRDQWEATKKKWL